MGARATGVVVVVVVATAAAAMVSAPERRGLLAARWPGGEELRAQRWAADGSTRGAATEDYRGTGWGDSCVPVDWQNTSDRQQQTTTLSARSRRCVTNKKGS